MQQPRNFIIDRPVWDNRKAHRERWEGVTSDPRIRLLLHPDGCADLFQKTGKFHILISSKFLYWLIQRLHRTC
jgi:hypothetical protein